MVPDAGGDNRDGDGNGGTQPKEKPGGNCRKLFASSVVVVVVTTPSFIFCSLRRRATVVSGVRWKIKINVRAKVVTEVAICFYMLLSVLIAYV